MRAKKKLVFGVGLNDAEYTVNSRMPADSCRKITLRCHFYRAWTGMLQRCYSDEYKERFPTYVGCTVSPEWLTFSVFRAWMTSQEWDGGCLDKDILIKGNKVYSADTCVFVSNQLNTFMIDCGAVRGDHPIGVSWDNRRGKFKAQCRNPFTKKYEHLGYFTCPNAAHESWRRRKHELACQYADMQKDQRIAEALRSRYAG